MTPAALRSRARQFHKAFGPIRWIEDRDELDLDLVFDEDYMDGVREIAERNQVGRIRRRLNCD